MPEINILKRHNVENYIVDVKVQLSNIFIGIENIEDNQIIVLFGFALTEVKIRPIFRKGGDQSQAALFINCVQLLLTQQFQFFLCQNSDLNGKIRFFKLNFNKTQIFAATLEEKLG